jgi:hypothetical protein
MTLVDGEGRGFCWPGVIVVVTGVVVVVVGGVDIAAGDDVEVDGVKALVDGGLMRMSSRAQRNGLQLLFTKDIGFSPIGSSRLIWRRQPTARPIPYPPLLVPAMSLILDLLLGCTLLSSYLVYWPHLRRTRWFRECAALTPQPNVRWVTFADITGVLRGWT